VQKLKIIIITETICSKSSKIVAAAKTIITTKLQIYK
jgi:hypothetical protein